MKKHTEEDPCVRTEKLNLGRIMQKMKPRIEEVRKELEASKVTVNTHFGPRTFISLTKKKGRFKETTGTIQKIREKTLRLLVIIDQIVVKELGVDISNISNPDLVEIIKKISDFSERTAYDYAATIRAMRLYDMKYLE